LGTVSMISGWFHTVGLGSDGIVVATGWNYYGQCNVDRCTDIIPVAAGLEIKLAK
jgi:alpha-tubulin suppressor-like RCC1 family protein